MYAYRLLVPALALITASFSTVAAVSPADAQSLTRYGMWGDNVKRRKSKSPSYSTAPPVNFGSKYALGAKPGLGARFKRKAPAKPIELAQGGPRPDIAPREPDIVRFNSAEYKAGEVVIDTSRRKLYLLLANDGYALAYPIAVGKQGFTWTGVEQVTHIQDWPDWFPPEEMRERSPKLPLRMTGGLYNPLGAKAIYLGKTLYRIHGTNAKWSIGRASSSGCFRMHNGHVVHLARLIDKTTTVHVLDRLPRGVVEDKKRQWTKKRHKRSKRHYRSRRSNRGDI